MLSSLPAHFPVPIVIVQHIPAEFSPILAQRLSQKCNLKVFEGSDGLAVEKGTVYIAPGGKHMEIKNGSAGLIFVQNAASSVVWGMPGAVVKAGLADAIIPLDDMGLRIRAVITGAN